MPLKKSTSKEDVKKNISKMVKEGKPIKQAVAAAKDTQSKAAAGKAAAGKAAAGKAAAGKAPVKGK